MWQLSLKLSLTHVPLMLPLPSRLDSLSRHFADLLLVKGGRWLLKLALAVTSLSNNAGVSSPARAITPLDLLPNLPIEIGRAHV